MKSKESIVALTTFLLLGGATLTSAQTGTTNPTGNATSAGTPSRSPSPSGATLPQGTPSATPTSNVTPTGAPSPGGDVLRGGTVNPSTNPASGSNPFPGGDLNRGGGQTAAPAGTTTTIGPGSSAAPTVGSPTGRASARDYRFAMRAAESGLAEVQLSTLALKQSTNPQVRDFAQQMLRDHSEMNAQLMRLATDRGIVLPSRLTPKDQASLDFLSRQSGARFDQHFLRHQARMHTEAQTLFQEAASGADDSGIGGFFAAHSPHITRHLETVQALAQTPDE